MVNRPENEWRALYVKSRCEKGVLSIIGLKGIEACILLVKSKRLWSNRKKTIEIPLFSGYVFVNITPDEFSIVLQTKGVVEFVKHEAKNARLRNIELKRLKHLINFGYQIKLGENEQSYFRGDKVKVIAGVLKNIEGFVVNIGSGKYIEIILDSLGRSIRFKLQEEIISKMISINV